MEGLNGWKLRNDGNAFYKSIRVQDDQTGYSYPRCVSIPGTDVRRMYDHIHSSEIKFLKPPEPVTLIKEVPVDKIIYRDRVKTITTPTNVSVPVTISLFVGILLGAVVIGNQ